MAIKSVIFSDIGGDELTDDNHVRVVVQHPDIPSAVELDASMEEAERLVSTTLRLVEITVYAPNIPPRTIQMETKVLDKLFTGVDFDSVLEGARKADQPRSTPPSPRRGRVPGAPTRPEKIDYSAMENAARPHRGRITDAEKATVRNNLDAINRRLVTEGHPTIDPNDPRMKDKWGF